MLKIGHCLGRAVIALGLYLCFSSSSSSSYSSSFCFIVAEVGRLASKVYLVRLFISFIDLIQQQQYLVPVPNNLTQHKPMEEK